MPLRAVKAEYLAQTDPLHEFSISWDDLTLDQVLDFEKHLSIAKNENDIHAFLIKTPILLGQHLWGGHGRWVIPKKRLGSEYVTDFIIGQRSSMGHEWQAVELESPKAKMFTKSGDPSRTLVHAIKQIQDWRAWLQRNQNYAARDKKDNGLGLTDITSNLKGVIFIGRREEISESTNELRRQMAHDSNVEIHSFDFLLEAADSRLPYTQT